MDNLFGNNPVSGENFYGRQKFVNQLVSLLKKGNSFLLLGLRRIGKSSVIEEVQRIITKENEIEVVYLNCQTHRGIEDFYKQLSLSLPRDLRERLSKYLRDSNKIPKKIIDIITDYIPEIKVNLTEDISGSIKFRNDILDYANPLRIEISNFFSKENKRIILLIDELPFLFEAISKSNKANTILEIESVLTTLRAWRNSKISMAVCGSLNLHQQLEELGISRKLLAGLITQNLPAFTREEAKGLLEALCRSQLYLSDDIIEQMLNQLPDYVPHFIQYFFHCVQNYEGELNTDVVENIYKEDFYPHLLRDFIYQFEERLIVFKGDDQTTARNILAFLSENQPVSNNDILNNIETNNTYEILIRLMDYEFVTLDKDLNYVFSLNVIKNWWINLNK